MAKLSELYPSNYLKADDLPDEGLSMTIKTVEVEKMGDDQKPVIYFKEKNETEEKGLVLNKTNADAIAQLTGSDDTDDWEGQRITIYPTETAFQGKTVPCIRVKLRAPKGKAKAAVAEPEEEKPSKKGDQWDDHASTV